MVDVILVVVAIDAAVVTVDVEELLAALVGGHLPPDVVTVVTWFVVGVVPAPVVDVGDGSTAPGRSTDGGRVVRVGADLEGTVGAVAGGAEVVDVTSSLVVGASSAPGAIVVPVAGTLGSAVTEVAPDGRRTPAAVPPTEPT